MCNLYNLKVSRDEVNSWFRASDDWRRSLEVEKEYVAPGGPGYVIREEDGQRVTSVMKWGFPFNGKPVTNVRNYRSSFWRSALANPERRCLVPVTRFQEWSVEPDPATGKKRPHWFTVPSQQIFAFAGIWRPTEGDPVFSFLTCGYCESDDPEDMKTAAAAHVVGAIHPKACPVILHPEDYDRWLHDDIESALPLACAYPSQLMAVS